MRRLSNPQPGYFAVREGAGDSGWYFDFNCPCGCGYESCIPIHRAGTPKRWSECWEWDGNVEQPTLSPSILALYGCRFHGHLRAGEWSVSDGPALAANCYRAGAGQLLQ